MFVKMRNTSAFKIRVAKIAFALVLALSSLAIFVSPASAADPDLTGGSPVVGQVSQATPISDLQVTGTGNPTVPVRLFVSSGTLAMSTTTGLTFTGPTTGSTLRFSGTLTDVNNALATLTYTRGSIGTDTLEVALIDPADVFFEDNGHLYEIVTSTLTWNGANSAASIRTKYGASGYLATITSENENSFIAARLTSAGWIGASDAASEGDWKWVTGPENGTSFWSGNQSGSPAGGNYSSWNTNEPNDSSGEDCAQFLTGGGFWNDLNCGVTTLSAYVVEYGAPGDMPDVAAKNVSITTANVPSTPSAPTPVAGTEEVEVSFSAPANNGSGITSYTVTASPGGQSATGSSSPLTVTGLTPGESYTFTVVATNAIGDSNASPASSAAIPNGAPVWTDDLLPMGRVDVEYSDGVTADGYPTAMTYTVTAGDLPDGLTLDPDTGALEGTPTQPGTFEFTIEADNTIGTPASQDFELEIATAPAIDLALEFEVGANIKNDISILVTGSGLEEASEYSVVVQSSPRTIGTGFVASDNSFASRVYLPRDLEPGSHSITVSGRSLNGNTISDTAYFRVSNSGRILAISNSSPIGEELSLFDEILANTGTNSIAIAVSALLFLITGLAILLSRRMRLFKQT